MEVFSKHFMIFRCDLFQYIFWSFDFLFSLRVAHLYRYKPELEKSK